MIKSFEQHKQSTQPVIEIKNLCKTYTSRWKKTGELSIPQAVLLLFVAAIIIAILVAIEIN